MWFYWKSGIIWIFVIFFLIVFNLRTARNWHMWQHICVCFLHLRLYRDWILGAQILVEKERLKTTEFWKTWRQEGKDPTKPKFPNKLFREKRESIRERKICVAHPSSVDCILLPLWNEASLSRIPELGTNSYTAAPSTNIKRFVKFSSDFVVENVGILEVGLGRRGITMKGWTVWLF